MASRIRPFREIILESKSGLLVEPEDPKAFADAICWLVTHPREALEMGECAQEHVRRHFSSEHMAAETLSLYQRLLTQHH